MRLVFGLVLLVGMGLAGFAVYLVNQQFASQESALERERQRSANVVSTVEIYAPSRDLTFGDLLTADDVKRIQYVRDDLPKGVFREEEDLFPEGLDTPRVVRFPMFTDEPILEGKVTEPGAPQGVTALLDPGMRAFPLPNSLTSAFGGDLRPGEVIDLYWIGRVGSGPRTSRLVKSRLEILATNATGSNGRGVMLQVTQEDFADLQVLRAAGSLSLTPVGRDDLAEGDLTIETDIRDVLGIEETFVAPTVEEQRCFVTQRTGTTRTQVEVECTD